LLYTVALDAVAFDPTRPPQLTTKSKSVKPKPEKVKVDRSVYRVSSILLGEQRKVAVINAKPVTIGDQVSDATVVDIDSAGVRLQVRGVSFTAYLPSGAGERSIRRSSGINGSASQGEARTGK
jgi:sRNA-binding protein